MIRIGLIGASAPHVPLYGRFLRRREEFGLTDFPEFGLSSIWDPDPEVATRLANELGIEQIASSPEAVIENSDAIWAAERFPGRRFAHARPALLAGLPTFITKPLADEPRQARELLELIRKTGTPVMSCSPLRLDASLRALKDRVQTIGPISLALAVGYREFVFYGFHTVEMLMELLGPGFLWAQATGRVPDQDEVAQVEWRETPAGLQVIHPLNAGERDIVHLQHRSGATAMIAILRDAAATFQLSLYGKRGWGSIEIDDGTSNPFYCGQLREFLEMIISRKSPHPPDEMAEVLAVLFASRESLATGRRISISPL